MVKDLWGKVKPELLKKLEIAQKEKFLVLVRFSEDPKKEWHRYVVGRVTRIGKLGGITSQAVFEELFDGSLVLGQNIDSVQKVILKEIKESKKPNPILKVATGFLYEDNRRNRRR